MKYVTELGSATTVMKEWDSHPKDIKQSASFTRVKERVSTLSWEEIAGNVDEDDFL